MPNLLHATPLLALIVVAACHAGAASSSPTSSSLPPRSEQAELSASADTLRDLEARYHLAVVSFDQGRYDDAAAQFAAVLLRVPQDPSGDHLRHLLVQHIGWSLLGAYDMSGDLSKLDSGEAILERYLVKHEQLLPKFTAEREDIYELIGEYSLRRDGGTPPNANAQLRALVRETERSIERPTSSKRKSNEDRKVRIIEVDTIRWATLDDPKIQRFLRDPRYAGSSLFENLGDPYNPVRVLVRGWVTKAKQSGGKRAARRAYTMLRAARPTLARCYEEALGRGADILERVDLDLRWDASGLDGVSITAPPSFDTQASRCVVEGLRDAIPVDASATQDDRGNARAKLHLSFFVQPERWPPRDSGEINQGARPEDTSRNPPHPTFPDLSITDDIP